MKFIYSLYYRTDDIIIMDYLPEINTLPGIMLYSFLAYLFSMGIAYLFTPKEYNIENFRDALRRERKNKEN